MTVLYQNLCYNQMHYQGTVMYLNHICPQNFFYIDVNKPENGLSCETLIVIT